MSESESNLRLGRIVETPVAGEIVRAFVPPALPPEPPIDVLVLLERLAWTESPCCYRARSCFFICM